MRLISRNLSPYMRFSSDEISSRLWWSKTMEIEFENTIKEFLSMIILQLVIGMLNTIKIKNNV